MTKPTKRNTTACEECGVVVLDSELEHIYGKLTCPGCVPGRLRTERKRTRDEGRSLDTRRPR